jgi:autotransporter adhesin
MSYRPYQKIERRKSRLIHVGRVPVDGDSPTTVQTMTNTPTEDAAATIGVNSVASTPNSVSFGSPGNERRLMNVAPAILPTDAPNLSQVKDLISGTVFNTQIRPVQAELRRGIAATAALPSVFMPSVPGRSSFAMNGATFAGENAMGFSYAYRLKVGMPALITAGYATSGGSEHVARVGFALEF